MHHRPPLRAIAHQRQHAVAPGAPGHAVDREIEAHARAVAVQRGLAQHRDAKALACQRQHALLGANVGGGIGGERLGRVALVTDHLRVLEAVDAARRGQEVAPDPGRPGHRGAAHARGVVDLFGRSREQLAARIIGDRRQIDDMVDTLQVALIEAADVGPDALEPGMLGQQMGAEEEAIERAHLVALRQQHRHQRRADVAARTGHQNPFHGHRWPCTGLRRAADRREPRPADRAAARPGRGPRPAKARPVPLPSARAAD